MKFNVILPIFVFFSLLSCKKNDPQIVSFTVDQVYTDVNFSFQSSGKVNSVEIAYGENESMLNEKSFMVDFTNGDVTKTIDELELVVGNTYFFRARAIGSKGKKGKISDWSGVKSLLVGTLCGQKPTSVSTSVYSLYWSIPDAQANNISYYQVEYGEQGFVQGSGTLDQTNSTDYSDMVLEEGKTYDFYVRSLCDNGYGFSEWNGPNSLYADQNKNLCIAPDYANYSMNYDFFGDPSSVEITFSDPGNCKNFEVNLVNDGQSVTANPSEFVDGTTISYLGLSYPANYDFYVRVICPDGGNTAWYGPLNISYQ